MARIASVMLRWYVFLMIMAVAAAHAAPEPFYAKVIDDDADGEEELVVETPYLKVVFERNGGRASRFIYKPANADLTWFGPYHGGDPGGGAFEDQMDILGFMKSGFRHANYHWTILDDGSQGVIRVRLEAASPAERTRDIAMRKTFTFYPDRTSVHRHHELVNISRSRTLVVDYIGWNRIRPGVPGSLKEQKAAPHCYYIPSEEGIKTFEYLGKPSGLSVEPSRGWFGSVAEDGQGALVTLSPVEDVVRVGGMMNLVDWPATTVLTRRGRLAPGGKLMLDWTIHPFQGLPGLSGGGPGLAGYVGTPEEKMPQGKPWELVLHLVPDRAGEFAVRVAATRLGQDGAAPKEIFKGGFTGNPGIKKALEFKWTPADVGTYDLAAIVTDRSGAVMGELNASAVVGDSDVPYTLAMKSPRHENDLPLPYRIRPGLRLASQIDWMTSRQGKPVRALFVHCSLAARELVDLMMRFDISIDAIFCGQGSSREFGYSRRLGPDKSRLLGHLARSGGYDVIFVSGVMHKTILDSAQEALVEAVRNGTGLVCLSEFCSRGKGDDSILTKSLFQDLKGIRHGRGREFGKGRFATARTGFWGFNSNTMSDPELQENVSHEYSFLRYGKLLLWAAGALPDTRIGSVKAEDGKVSVDVISEAPQAKNLVLVAEMRGPAGEVLGAARKSFAVAAGEKKTLEFELPEPTRNGRHHVVAFLRTPLGMAVDADCRSVSFKSPYRIAKGECNAAPARRGGAATVLWTLEADEATAAELELSVEDSYGRLLSRERRRIDLPVGGDTVEQRIDIGDPITHCINARARLLVNGVLRDRKRARVYVRTPHQVDDLWLGGMVDLQGPAYTHPLILDRLTSKYGFRWATGRRTVAVSDYNLLIAPWGMCYAGVEEANRSSVTHGKPISDENWERGFCIHKKEHLAGLEREVKKRTEREMVHSPPFYHLSDEYGLLSAYDRREIDLCYGSATMAAFRAHLKEKFGSLKAVNARWDTHFASWDEVIPWKTEQARKKTDNIGAWLDFKMFMSHEFSKLMGKAQQWIREVDTRDNVYGTLSIHYPGPFTCTEPAINAKYTGMACLHHAFGMTRSAFYDKASYPNWTLSFLGYGWGTERLRHDIWANVAHGNAFTHMFTFLTKAQTDNLDDTYIGLADERLYETPYTHVIGAEMRTAREGIAKAVMTAEHVRPQTAVLLNVRSRYLYHLLKKATSFMWGEGFGALAMELDELQTPALFVTEEQLAEGALKGLRLLVVSGPSGEIIGDELLKAMAQFVRGGATLVINSPETFAERDDAGKLIANRPLRDKLLKLVRKANGDATLEQLIDKQRLRDHVTVTDPATGRRVPGVSIVRHTRGAIDYVMLVRVARVHQEVPEALRVSFAEPAHLYEMRGFRYYGRVKDGDIRLPDAGGLAFARLRYRVQGVSVNAASPAVAPGERVVYDVAITATSKPGDHVVHVDVARPDGKVLHYYGGNFVTRRGKLRLEIPIAVNDPVGLWRISVHDSISGKRDTETFFVKEK